MQKLLGIGLYDYIDRNVSFDEVTEIRLRVGKKICVKTAKFIRLLPYIASDKDILYVINTATNFSRYAHETEISNGFLTYGNIRVGICGEGIINDKNIIVYKTITSLCIRIPHRIALPHIVESLAFDFKNTLVYGPPYSGKTTFIRALAEKLSQKNDTVIIDERYEIVGNVSGSIDGQYADVLQGIPKSRAFESAIRCLAPQIVVCDELFTENDVRAVHRFHTAGIHCLASYHADTKDKIPDSLREIFQNLVCLTNNPTVGTIQSIERNGT